VVVPARLPLRRVVAGRLVRVVVDASHTGQKMRGRVVELQRRAGDGWVRVRSARLQRVGAVRYQATFRVARHGLTIRVRVPVASGGPCYLASSTSSWTS